MYFSGYYSSVAVCAVTGSVLDVRDANFSLHPLPRSGESMRGHLFLWTPVQILSEDQTAPRLRVLVLV